MFKFIRESHVIRSIMALAVLQIIFDVLFSQLLYANYERNYEDYSFVNNAPLTKFIGEKSVLLGGIFAPRVAPPPPAPNGPDQPEANGPSGVESNNMVDPFTGDFSFSVPLFEIGNIPVSLNYTAGVGMEQEASWVGLGWSLNPGSINRQVRGLPDDFKNDLLIEEVNIRPNRTYGVTVQPGLEFLGLDKLDPSIAINILYNNYSGLDITTSISGSIFSGELGSIGLTLESQSKDNFGDLGINPTLNLGSILGKAKAQENPEYDYELNIGFSSNKGLKGATINRVQNHYETETVVTGASIKPGEFGFPVVKIESNEVTNKVGSGNAGIYSLNVSNLMNDLSFTPRQNYEFENYAFTFNAAFGVDAVTSDTHLKLQGFYSQQTLKDNSVVTPTQGYLYLENGVSDVLMDFNRESDGPVEENSPNLSPSYLTPDLYMVNSPGLAGVFRAYRDEVGYVEENNIISPSISASGGLEFSIGNLTSPGFDIAVVNSSTTSEEWTGLNAVDNTLRFTGNDVKNDDIEKVHFAMMGENGAERDPGYIEAFGGADPIEFNAVDLLATSYLKDQIMSYSSTFPEPPIEEILSGSLDDTEISRDARASRTIDITYQTLQEQRQFEILPKYKICTEAKSHHVSKMIITNEDGTRYVYGLPVYNISSYEVTFNVGQNLDGSGSITTYSGNRVKYDGDQASIDNESGIDHFFSRRYTPAHASSYLLTEILSSDYVDITGDGPSPDDLGNYVEYTYGVQNSETGLYEPDIPELKWRTPNVETEYQANYWEGFESIDTDDKANFMYGTKEVWYLSKIESKEYVAEFNHTAKDRKDGYETLGIDGGINTAGGNLLHRLNSIQLYTTMELQWAEELSEDPTPEKTVIFDYSHELCDLYILNKSGTTGNEGKLTLTAVSFKYKDSNKARYSGYTFDYHEDEIGENPNYSFTSIDRWGNYKPNPGGGKLPNWKYPYVDQSDTDLDIYAGAWSLKEIITPEDAKITIEYEADNYAYVQNMPATQLFEIVSVETDPDNFSYSSPKYELFSFEDASTEGELNDTTEVESSYYLVFKLSDNLTTSNFPTASDANEYIRTRYLLNNGQSATNAYSIPQNLYFKFKLNLNEIKTGEGKDFEYVSGYCKLDVGESDWSGAIASGESGTDYDYGYIRLEPENLKLRNEGEDQSINSLDGEINPISKAGFQYTMENARYNILDENAPGETDDEGVWSYLADIFLVTTLVSFFKMPNSIMCKREFCSEFDAGNAWVRLQNPRGFKYGGGYRVSKIIIEDNWDEMTDSGVAMEVVEDEARYTVDYLYTTESDKGLTISSGVASYEPNMGGDENPFKRPIEYNFKEDNTYRYKKYKEYPFGETFFPSPQVGYSKVTILTNESSSHKRTGTGFVVKEFYTLKDRPTKVSWTRLTPITYKSGPILSLFSKNSITSYTGSQGYAVETSNIHGKPKSVSAYPEGSDVPIVQTVYFYKDDNLVTTIDKQGHFHEAQEIGTTYELTVDMRTNVNESLGTSFRSSLDIFWAFGALIGIPTIPIMINYSRNESNLSVVTKVINHSIVLDYVEQTDNGSTVSTKNVYFDHYTGQPIVTTIQNEFNDEYYSVNYPAHWLYQGMDFSASNSRYMFTSTETTDNLNWVTGKLTSSVIPYLNPGDIIGVRPVIHYGGEIPSFGISEIYGSISELCWVYEETDAGCPSGPCYYLIDRDGNVPDFTSISTSFDGGGTATELQFIVLQSGSRNLHSASIGSTVMKEDPMVVGFDAIDEDASIISSYSVTYSDKWQKFCVPKATSTVDICLCDEEVPLAAQQFFNVIKSLLTESIVYSSVLSGPKIDDETLYQESTSGESYYHDMTALLKDIIISYDPPILPYEEYATGYPTGTSNQFNLELNIDETSFHSGGTTCEYLFKFYTDEEYTPGYEYDLTSESLFNDLFGDTEELELEFSVIPESDAGCANVSGFNINMGYINSSGIPSVVYVKVVNTVGGCFPFRNCDTKHLSVAYCSGDTGQVVNPYVQGLLGIWRPNISYAYLVDRTPGSYTSSDPELRFDGNYDAYSPFWERAGTDTYWQQNTTDQGWTWAQKVEVMDAKIGQIETVNALDIYGAASYGFNHRTAEMVVENARYQYVGFESFEDNTYHDDILKMECLTDHFNLANGDDLTTERAHSGYFSMKIEDGVTYTYTTLLMDAPPQYPRDEYPSEFTIAMEDCVPPFAPELGASGAETYILSMWIYQAFDNADPIYTYEDDIEIDVLIGTGPTSIAPDVVFRSIVDGWQQVDVVFTVPAYSVGDFELQIENTSETDNIYVDDVRIMPYDARANCYVYDYKNYRLLSELDANHFATFYDYDEEGRLTRVRKETENGIMTISENRYSTVKREFE